MRTGMKLAVALTALLGLLALAASVFLAVDQYRDLASPTAYRESMGVVEAPFVFGVALLIASVGLIKSQNWARLQVVISAVLFAGCLALLSVLAFTFAEELTTSVLVPVFALPGGLACLWVVYYVSFGPGRSHFPSVTSRSSMVGCGMAAGCVAAALAAGLGVGVMTAVWDIASDVWRGPSPETLVPATSTIEAELENVLAHVPGPSRVEARPCPDAEIEKGSPESERIRGYVGTVVFVWPILSDSHEAPGQPAQGWEWLTHPTIRRLPAGRDLDRRGVGTLRYLAVVRAFERNLPQPLAEGDPLSPNRRRLIAGSHFRPGTFRGGLFIMDIKRAALVCQIPLEVTSRPILDYSPGGAFGTTARDALERDFKKQFLENARAAVRRISRIVRVSYP